MHHINCEHINNKQFKCKNKYALKINNTCLCYNHGFLIYNKYVLIIQKIYIGFRTRKKLKLLFYNLPVDLQKIVLFYINKPIYNRRYYRKIYLTIRNKSENLLNNKYNLNKIDINYINTCYKLYNKYRNICLLNDLKYLYVISNHFIYIYNSIIYGFIINNDIYQEILNIIDFSNTNLDQILNSLYVINSYKYMYELNYINNYKYMYESNYSII